MHIWEIDYLSDSDDEDNDDAEESSSGDSSDEGFQLQKPKKKLKKAVKDVVDILIQNDLDLLKRDLQSRSRRIAMRTSQQHKICSLPETPEFTE